MARVNTIAELRGLTQFVGLQIPYNLVRRDPERDLLPMARELGLAVCAWAPLGAGLLTGKYTRKEGKGRLSQPDEEISEKSRKSAEELDRIAKSIGHPPAQVALNWVRQQEGVVIPLTGATKPSQIKENLECLDFRLTEDQMKQLDEIGKIDLGFPHEFLRSDHVRKLILGDTFPLIDHR